MHIMPSTPNSYESDRNNSTVFRFDGNAMQQLCDQKLLVWSTYYYSVLLMTVRYIDNVVLQDGTFNGYNHYCSLSIAVVHKETSNTGS